jgi:hypothetical protein
MVEAVTVSETSVIIYRSTRRYIPQDNKFCYRSLCPVSWHKHVIWPNSTFRFQVQSVTCKARSWLFCYDAFNSDCFFKTYLAELIVAEHEVVPSCRDHRWLPPEFTCSAYSIVWRNRKWDWPREISTRLVSRCICLAREMNGSAGRTTCLPPVCHLSLFCANTSSLEASL